MKTPLFPYEFFNIFIDSNNHHHLFLVKYQDKVIGGSLCVSYMNEILYEWFVCGLDGRYKNRYPSTLATWAAIEYAASNGFNYFDMMGAGKPDEGYGVRNFKAKFGGELVEHGRFIRVNKPILYYIGKKAVSYLKKKK
ncbi:MAG: peptidoglycan bridge formation glycyltransferase FemA/FemB family protein [Paludibacteraceae bacterium]